MFKRICVLIFNQNLYYMIAFLTFQVLLYTDLIDNTNRKKMLLQNKI